MSGGKIEYTIASLEEGKRLMRANTKYFQELTLNDREFRMKKSGATLDEFINFSVDQVREFTEKDKTSLNNAMALLERLLDKRGLKLPVGKIIYIKTTMIEEGGALAYTHGNEIYIGQELLDQEPLECVKCLTHEMWHCISQVNPELRRLMYNLIGFTIVGREFAIPQKIKQHFITNPDVMHHDSYAKFNIRGIDADCFCIIVTVRPFKPGDESFFQLLMPLVVLADGSERFFPFSYVTNLDSVFGSNTGYTIDPEECMADNFSYAFTYGMEGKDGKGYPDPQIIEGILKIFKK